MTPKPCTTSVSMSSCLGSHNQLRFNPLPEAWNFIQTTGNPAITEACRVSEETVPRGNIFGEVLVNYSFSAGLGKLKYFIYWIECLLMKRFFWILWTSCALPILWDVHIWKTNCRRPFSFLGRSLASLMADEWKSYLGCTI